jgi:lysophospholipase L1-like esterase
MKNNLTKFSPVLQFLLIDLCLEIVERGIDICFGDGDNKITHFNIDVFNTLLQICLGFLAILWLPEVGRKIKQDSLSKKNVFEEYPITTIISITLPFILCIDFLAAQWLWRQQATNTEVQTYRMPHAYYHHTLQPKKVAQETWGNSTYTLFTNSLGFKDADTTTVLPTSPLKRILFIGDSFTEGIGVPFEQTFVGMVRQSFQSSAEVLGAGCVSYSPKLCYYKTKYLLEKEKLQINQLFLFIDISDIQDEITYETFVPIDETAPSSQPPTPTVTPVAWYEEILHFWAKGSVLGYLIYQKHLQSSAATFNAKYYNERAKWTYDENIYQKWGSKGVQSAVKYTEQLLNLCRTHQIKMTIVIYPWTEQMQEEDWNSKQVTIWDNFAKTNQLDCVNFFPIFQRLCQQKGYDKMYQTYFIKGDVHWNEAGHRIIANEVIKYLNSTNNLP